MGIFKAEKLTSAAGALTSGIVRPRVLIVDDEDANRAVMASILRPYFELLEARDGQEALDMVRAMPDAHTLACVVSDHRMPRLTGVQLFEQLRTLVPGTSRIVVTGFMDVSVVVASINDAAIYKYIVKPFDAHDFLLTVQRAVESVQMQRMLDAHHADLERKVLERTMELSAKYEALEHEIATRRAAEQAVAEERAFSLSMVKLTPREYDCLTWSVAGKTAWETGQILGLSEWTVVYHLERCKRKFGLNSKQQLVARAVSLGLVRPSADAACAVA